MSLEEGLFKKQNKQVTYFQTTLKNALYVDFSKSESKTTSDWLNQSVRLIRGCVTINFTKSCRKRQENVLENGW